MLWPFLMWSQTDLVKWYNADFAPSLIENHITASNITSSGVTLINESWGTDNVFYSFNGSSSTSIDTSKYVQFAVSPDAGYKIVFNSFSFNSRSQGNGKKEVQNYQVRYSKDANFSSYTPSKVEFTNSSNYTTNTIDLGKAVVSSGETLYIRIYSYNTNNNFHIEHNNSGTVAPIINGTVSLITPIAVVANDDKAGLVKNTSSTINVLSNDDYKYTSPVTAINITKQPDNGAVSVDGITGKVIYTPVKNYVGYDDFRYTVTNAVGVSNTAIVQFQVLDGTSGTSTVLERWNKSDNSPVNYVTGVTGSNLSVAGGVSVSNISNYWVSGVPYNAFQYKGMPINTNLNGNLDSSKYIQFVVTTSNALQTEVLLKKLNFEYNSYARGNMTIKYSKDSNFTNGVYTLVNNTAFTDDHNSWYPLDASFTDGSFVYPGEAMYIRIYLYNMSYSEAPFFMKYAVTSDTSVLSGVTLSGIASNYYPAPCSVTAVWNTTGWVNNVKPDINKKAIINADYDTLVNGSFEACSVQVNKGKLSISKDKYVKVNKTIETTNGGSIEVQSDGNLLQVDDSIVNASSITVLREAKLKRLDYNLWSSPVDGQNLKAFSPNTVDSRFYVYNERNDYFDGVFSYASYTGFDAATAFVLKDKNSYNFEKAKGYGIRASNYATATPTTITATFKGIPNNGQIKVKISKHGNGNNLVGNPYPSNIDMKKLAANNSGLIEELAYFWTNFNPTPAAQQGSAYPANGAVNNYATYNGSGSALPLHSAKGVNKPTQYLKVGQGFIVKVKDNVAAGEYDLKFDNSVRNADGASTFYNVAARTASKQEQAVDRFWLELETPLGLASQMLIAYKKEATNDFEWSYDAPAMIEGSDAIYSILGNQKLVIEGRKYPLVSSDAVPLGASFDGAGTHTISLGDKEGIFANGQNVYLKDKITGITTNLSETSYSFTASAGQDNNRFEIVYVNTNSTLATDASAKKQLMVYQSEGFVNIDSPENMNKVFMFDATGKLVYQNNVSGKSAKINAAKFTSGVYMVNIETVNGKQTKKILIK